MRSIMGGDRLVARVDLKADRQSGRLTVQSAFCRAGVDKVEVAGALSEDLGEIRNWLGLDRDP